MTARADRGVRPPRGLTVVGSGICSIAHVTLETARQIRLARRVLYLVADPVTEEWIREQNPRSESLIGCYPEDRPLRDCYREIVERILSALAESGEVCAVFYGHPGVFTYPSHEAIRLARARGHAARMLPGISAEDCLFADLGVDPGEAGCQSFEASDFLQHRRRTDPSCALILWQIGAIGRSSVQRMQNVAPESLRTLAERLREDYPPDHELVAYEAAQFSVCRPHIQRIRLAELPDAEVPGLATLLVPPINQV